MRVGGRPAVVAQWQSTGGSSQRCPGFNSRRLPAFFTFLYFRLMLFRLNAPVVIRAKVKEVRNNAAIYSHALPRIYVIGGQRSVRIAPPSQPHHSGPATRDFQSSISVETLFHRCHLDVQGLLYQQLLSSTMVQYGVLPPYRA